MTDIGLRDDVVGDFDALYADLIAYIYHCIASCCIQTGDFFAATALEHLGNNHAQACVDALGTGAAGEIALVIFFVQIQKITVQCGFE